jgi:hypothetical protein
MGDNFDFENAWEADNVYERDTAVDFVDDSSVESDGEVDDAQYEDKGEASTTKTNAEDEEAKKAAKKRKIQALKERKRAIVAAATVSDDEEDRDPSDGRVQVDAGGIPTDSEAQLSHMLSAIGDLKREFPAFTSRQFFDPTCVENTPSQCPYTRAIAAQIKSHKKILNRYDKSDENNGSPVVLIICSSAIRATQVISSLSKTIKCRIAKLFAKHFKLQDQIEILSKQQFTVAVGTPNRLLKLAEYGALKLHQLRAVIIDMHKDEKNFSVLSMPDVNNDLVEFMKTHVYPESSHIKLALVAPLAKDQSTRRDKSVPKKKAVPKPNKKQKTMA